METKAGERKIFSGCKIGNPLRGLTSIGKLSGPLACGEEVKDGRGVGVIVAMGTMVFVIVHSTVGAYVGLTPGVISSGGRATGDSAHADRNINKSKDRKIWKLYLKALIFCLFALSNDGFPPGNSRNSEPLCNFYIDVRKNGI